MFRYCHLNPGIQASVKPCTPLPYISPSGNFASAPALSMGGLKQNRSLYSNQPSSFPEVSRQSDHRRHWTAAEIPPKIGAPLTRQPNISCSEPQASSLSRRVPQAIPKRAQVVTPLARRATPRGEMPEAPNRLIINDRPSCARPRSALSKLAVGVLQRRFDALP